MASRNREAAQRKGKWAEALCRLLLRLKGYRILAQTCRTPLGEIDIVARRGRVLAVIEVKARATLDEALLSLSPRQCARLGRAAHVFLARHPGLAALDLRFDLMLVAPWTWPRHMEDAWRPE